MRLCKIAPLSCLRPGRPCCKGCEIQDCPARCRNSPDRCNCVGDGPPPRKRSEGKGRSRSLDWDEIARLRGLGLTIAQIAERIPCSQGSVCNTLKKMGVGKRGQS